MKLPEFKTKYSEQSAAHTEIRAQRKAARSRLQRSVFTREASDGGSEWSA